MRVEEAVAGFVASLDAAGLSPYTIRNYRAEAAAFLEWAGGQEPTPASLHAYQALLVKRQASAQRLYHAITALRAYCRSIKSTAAEGLVLPKRPKPLPDFLSEDEAARLRRAAQERPDERAIVGLLLYAGLRNSELRNLRLHDLDFELGVIHVTRGKGSKDRIAPFPDEAQNDTRRWLSRRSYPNSDYLFPGRHNGPIARSTLSGIVTRCARRANLKRRVWPHLLRHTLATTLLRKGAGLRAVQKILGHSSIISTEIYTHLDVGDLRRMYAAAQPQF